MLDFISSQIDYIHFLTGAAFVCLGLVVWDFKRRKGIFLNWSYLIGFALISGCLEWAHVFFIPSTTSSSAWSWFLHVLELAGFVCLFEFFRKNIRRFVSWTIPAWVYVLLGILGLGVARIQGLRGLEWFTHLAVAVPAMVGSAWVFWKHRGRESGTGDTALARMSLALLWLSLSWGIFEIQGLITPWTRSLEMDAPIRAEVVLHFIRMLGSMVWMLAMWHFTLKIRAQKDWTNGFFIGARLEHSLALVMFLVFLGGWVMTDWIGVVRNREERQDVLQRAQAGAYAIPVSELIRLKFNRDDRETARYQILRKKLWDQHQVSPLTEDVYLVVSTREGLTVAVDSVEEDAYNYREPGTLFFDAPKEFMQALSAGQKDVIGPYSDRWGTHMTALIPLRDPARDTLVALFCLDFSASEWMSMIARARLWPIGITGLLFLILLMYLLIHQHLKESSNILAASELRNRSVVEGSPNCVFLLDDQGRLQTINQVGVQTFRLTQSWLGIRFADLWPEKIRTGIRGDVERALSGERAYLEYVYDYSDGRRVVLDGILNPVTEGHHVKYVVGILRDITAQKNAQEYLRQSEERFRETAENIQDGIAVSENGKIVYVNDRTCEIFGYSREELLGLPDLDFYTPEEKSRIRQLWKDARVQHMPQITHEAWILTKNNQRKFIQSRHSIRQHGENELVYSSLNDITARKQSEEAQGLFRSVLEHSQDYIFITEAVSGKIVDVNSSLCQVLGYTREQMLTMSTLDFDVMLSTPEDRERFAQIVREEGHTLWETEYRRKDATVFTIEINVGYIPFPEMSYHVVVARDVTERKNMESRLENNLNFIQTVLDTIPNPFYFKNEQGVYQGCNRAFETFLGKKRSEIIGKTVFDLSPRDLAEEYWAKDRVLLEQRGVQTYESRVEQTDGTFQMVMFYKAVYTHPETGELGLLGLILDITELKAIQEKNTFQLYLLENVSEAIIATDPQNRIAFWNAAAQRMYGWSAEEVVGRTLGELLSQQSSEDEQNRIERALTDHGRFLGEVKHWCKDGTALTVEVVLQTLLDAEGRFLGYMSLNRNVSERKVLQDQLFQAQKMESIGRLAAGIAHEINTPTQYVGDNIRFLQDSFGDVFKLLDAYAGYLQATRDGQGASALSGEMDLAVHAADLSYVQEEVPKAFKQTLDGIERISTIVRAMKEFAHPGTEEKVPVDLNHAIESTLTVARNEWKYVADMVTDFDPALPSVPCLVNEFNQVVLNMVVNAAHAIGELVGESQSGEATGKGTITVSTRRVGEFAEVRISDTGAGIPEAILSKVFDPFFTTKPVGKGTGQGLAISRNVIVEKHHGTIDVESKVGKGTAFILRLPLLAESTAPGKATP